MASIFHLVTSLPPLSYLPVRRCNGGSGGMRGAEGNRGELELSGAEDLWDSTRFSGTSWRVNVSPYGLYTAKKTTQPSHLRE
jgi:hypothetical protein